MVFRNHLQRATDERLPLLSFPATKPLGNGKAASQETHATDGGRPQVLRLCVLGGPLTGKNPPTGIGFVTGALRRLAVPASRSY